jgi:hypothetical protein
MVKRVLLVDLMQGLEGPGYRAEDCVSKAFSALRQWISDLNVVAEQSGRPADLNCHC